MIPYEDLVAALTGWRQRNGLPTGGAEYAAAPAAGFDVDVIAGDGDLATNADELEVDALAVEEIYEVGEDDELEVDADYDASAAADPHTYDEGEDAGDYDASADAAPHYDAGASAEPYYDEATADAADAEVDVDSEHTDDEELLEGQDTAYADAPADHQDESAGDELVADELIADELIADELAAGEALEVQDATMVAQADELGDDQTRVGDGMDLGTLDEDSTSIGSLPPTEDDDDRS